MLIKKKRPLETLDISSHTKRKRVAEDEIEVPTRKKKAFRKQDDEDDLPPKKAKKAIRREFPTRAPMPEQPLSGRTRKLTVLEEERRPKRKPSSLLPAVIPPKLKRKLSKLDPNELTSIMGDAAEEISQLLEDSSNETATSLIHKRLLQSLIDAIAHAEHNVRASKGAKGTYQLNSLVSSVRELLIDVQSTRDKGVLGETIVERVVRPAFLDLAMELAREHELLKAQLRTILDEARFIKVEQAQMAFLQKIASSIQNKYGELKDGIVKSIQG